ncbi:zinc finger protein 507 [Erpetoichthys calabaricus]|uniref:zinc finger protein 507 n=1 Tax=Erpetoichthys calabaricus TaxID=27687 RepID=UPI0022345AE6|nr:zinc finger protein 507 [Erpetoichthys calabaricus]
MEENNDKSLLISQAGSQNTMLITDRTGSPRLQGSDDKQKQNATDSLIQVIEKLSKIVENKRQRRCSIAGKKRAHLLYPSLDIETREISETAAKIVRCDDPSANEYCFTEDTQDVSSRNVSCYVCSLCKFLFPSLEILKEHLKLHDTQNDVILVCSECCFTSRSQEDLEAHIKMHLETVEHNANVDQHPLHHIQDLNISREQGNVLVYAGDIGSLKLDQSERKANLESVEAGPEKKKWYTYERYGMYRCLICSYTCSQQRMLKTHAWKHAGEVDCSYPIFEDESEPSGVLDVTSVPQTQTEEAVILLAQLSKTTDLQRATPVQFQISSSDSMREKNPVLSRSVNETSDHMVDHAILPNPPDEEVVTEEETASESDQENATSDSLLSSAQKIISCSPNKAGHVNVIVERLPGAEEGVSSKQFLINTDIDDEKRLLTEDSRLAYYEDVAEVFQSNKGAVAVEEVVIGWCNNEKQSEDGESKVLTTADENTPPVRRRTHSESLRLHSLAAEALVAMPTRTPEVMKSIAELNVQHSNNEGFIDLSNTSQQKLATTIKCSLEEGVRDNNSTVLMDSELQSKAKSTTSEVPVKMGISMSLLTVIEKLRERTDQNASDDDILKELKDNAQSQPNSDANLSGNNLVEYIPESERPYRCRLCRYTSGNKGYIKQHLRVHRQRQPYQCPICEHIAEDSKDLENHMINHCKTRMYHCKQCQETFYYKSQLRAHEREKHDLHEALPSSSSAKESKAPISPSQDKSDDEELGSTQKVYKCDICDYTSSTYVGVRNHRRIHSSDKPYRCSSCDFATTNMNSLKSHMRRHPQELQAVQLIEQYRCSLCGYVCSHPPSLKSHMWKHAGDQNYNYEQVNRAINDAISQSSRSQCAASKRIPCEPAIESASASPVCIEKSAAGLEITTATEENTVVSDGSKMLGTSKSLHAPDKTALGQLREGMEYCVLLFCCCICGFESMNKELLMEHMKEHEGEIISIILNKEQSTNAAQNSPK